MLVTDADKVRKFGVQSRALSKRQAASLGRDLTALRAEWWIITIHANSDNPVCYILTIDEVRKLASQDKGGQQAYWLEPRDYDRDEYRDAWERIGLAPAA